MTSAQEILREAISGGRFVQSTAVSRTTFPGWERSYVSDGTGIAWQVPPSLRARGSFALDAELPRPVRGSLARRYGVTDPVEFAHRWTRAEALAKVFDAPILTWLSRHGLDVPDANAVQRPATTWAWQVREGAGLVCTCAVRLDLAVPGLSVTTSSLGSTSRREG